MESMIFSETDFAELKSHNTDSFEFVFFTKKSPLKDTVNEDSIGYVILDNNNLVLTVADGAGGHPKGEEASKEVIKCIQDKLYNIDKGVQAASVRHQILDGIEHANTKLINSGVGAKTTVTVCEVLGRQLRAYNVGDSSLLVCGQKGKLKTKTLSHSPVGFGVEAGLITEEDALDHPDLNIVANLVGENDMTIEMGSRIELDDKDTVLLASDGVFDNFPTQELSNLIRTGSLQEAGLSIVEYFDQRLVLDPQGKETKFDDLSFFLCRLRE